MPPLDDEERNSIVDIDAATAEISSDLFGDEEDDESTIEEPGEGSTSASGVEPPPAQSLEAKEVTPDNSQEVQEVGAPKTWTKEALEKWTTIDPVVQKEIAKREEDMFRGIEMYKGAAELGQRYDQVVEPYREILKAADIDPVNLFNSFAANHYILSSGTDEQKLELAANLIYGYNIDLGKLVSFMGDRVSEPVDPRIANLEKQISELSRGIDSRSRVESERMHDHLLGEVNTFASDGAHPYFDEVATDIARFIETGYASSLQDAYDKAIFANPATRQKELDRLAAEKVTAAEAEAKSRKDKRQKSMGDHVATTPRNKNGTVPVGSMDDTLEEKMREIESRG